MLNTCESRGRLIAMIPPITLAALFGLFTVLASVASAVDAPKYKAMLGVFFQNDNEGYEATSNAERERITALEAQFKSVLEVSGRYKFVPMTPPVQAKVRSGQLVGECGGCEIEYGKALGADTIAWVQVQKVSNLIMNMNVFIADVSTNRMLFKHSVDVRGNTDESWSRSMNYLLKNYLLPPAG